MKKSSKIKEYDCLCAHIAIFVKDIKKVSKFYKTKLGFRLKRDYSIDKEIINKLFCINRYAKVNYLEREGLGIELIFIPKLKKRKKDLSGYHHWAMLVKNKDSFCGALRKKRVKVISFKRTNDFVYFIQDPERNYIEIKNKTA